jgi:glycosyltransferase involved in cell wall biosynthesis
MEYFPLVSVITPSLNRAKFISGAVQSVSNQEYSSVEHIVIDGGSTDSTLEVLKAFPHIRLISEPDRGLYDALNKGLCLAGGDIIGFLNTDDVYEAGCFSHVVRRFLSEPKIDAVVGRATVFQTLNQHPSKVIKIYPRIPTSGFLFEATAGASIFNAWFFRRRLFDQLGKFDTRYLYAADREFLIRMALNRKSYTSINQIVYHYRQHPGSLTITGKETGGSAYQLEFLEIAEKYLRYGEYSPFDRETILYWHGVVAADISLSALKGGRAKKAWKYAIRGMRVNPVWIGRFLSRALRGLQYLAKNNLEHNEIDAVGSKYYHSDL